MAKMVTRTIEATKLNVFCLNDQNELIEVSYDAPTTFKDDKAALKYVDKNFNDGLQHVRISSKEVTAKRYGLEESKFIAIAKVID